MSPRFSASCMRARSAVRVIPASLAHVALHVGLRPRQRRTGRAPLLLPSPCLLLLVPQAQMGRALSHRGHPFLLLCSLEMAEGRGTKGLSPKISLHVHMIIPQFSHRFWAGRCSWDQSIHAMYERTHSSYVTVLEFGSRSLEC